MWVLRYTVVKVQQSFNSLIIPLVILKQKIGITVEKSAFGIALLGKCSAAAQQCLLLTASLGIKSICMTVSVTTYTHVEAKIIFVRSMRYADSNSPVLNAN